MKSSRSTRFGLFASTVIASASFCGVSQAGTLTNDLLVHLTFDNANFTDDSGNGLNGTPEGNPQIVPGFIGGGAVALTTMSDGSEFDYVTLGYPSQLMFDTTESFSISYWTSYTNQSGDIPFISNKDWNSSGNPGWGIFTQGGGSFRINVTDNTSSSDKENTENTPDIRDGKWHQVAVTFDRSLQVVNVYVDGKFYSSDPSMANVTGNIDTDGDGLAINIGQDGTGTYTDSGSGQIVNLLMDDLGIWGRVISGPEVSAIYDGGIAGSNLLQVTVKLLPFADGFSPTPLTVSAQGTPVITATLHDADTAVNVSTVTMSLDGTALPASVVKSNTTTQIQDLYTNLLPAGSTHTVALSFSDNATPANLITTNWTFTVLNYPTIPESAAQPSGAVDTGTPGFQMRVSQISSAQVLATDGTALGNIPTSVAGAEAQLAGVATDPMTGLAQVNIATPGSLANGAYPITSVVNFSTFGIDQGNFTSANGYPKTTTPGLDGTDDDNSAVEIVTYLYLPAGYYQFGCNSADGYRVTIGTNAYDALSTQVGLYDARSIPFNTTFSFAVAQTGYYATRIVWFRQGVLADNSGSAGLEFYTISATGQKTLVNDPTGTNAVHAYQSSSASYGPYVKYAGPTSFISTYRGNDFGSPNVTVQLHDGSSAIVTPSSVHLSVDGAAVNATVSNNNAGVTTVTYTPGGLQLKRAIHTGQVVYTAGSTSYTNTWQFDHLRNYVLPTALYPENFDELSDGQLPANWQQINYTTPEEPANTTTVFTDPNSAAFLGWTALNVNDGGWGDWPQHFNVGLYQELNGKFFDAATNVLMSNQFLYAESDNRSDQQIQYLYTQKYNLTGKVGTVIAFNSSYEQNQNNIDGLEYTLDGTNWSPVIYLLQGANDAQQNAQIVWDGNGNVNVTQTMGFAINPHYTNSSDQIVGGAVGAFIGAPITQALAPYIDGRVNDDSYESMRFEAFNVPGADNQSSVQFRFFQVGTGSWFWGIDSLGIYSVPSLVSSVSGLGQLTGNLSGNNLVLTWSAGSNVVLQQNSNLGTASWTTVTGTAGVGTHTVTGISGQTSMFYRLAQP